MGGAQVVGMAKSIGSFERSKKFDALLIDVQGIVSPNASLWTDHDYSSEARVDKSVFLGEDRNICKVYVDGKLVAGHDVG